MKYLSRAEGSNPFESLYLEVRDKERRLLDDYVVAQLPNVSSGQVPNAEEWKLRAASFSKLQQYFGSIASPKQLLDIGCGNGWAAAGLADNSMLHVSAVDVNTEELQQAERVFSKPNLEFYYGDVFEDIFPAESFDYIILYSSAQYFQNITALINRLFFFLKSGGEIHILDTPFYGDEEIAQAKQRSLQYYVSLGTPEMANHYFHHRLSDLTGFRFELLSGQKGIWNRFREKIRRHTRSNFVWIRLRK